uniref:Uncharacterized protein n=1 Tax=Brassica campestris TaxID=3711 RepID=A0A3P6CSW2_BRACM|nr:unnamed protein product [Brassica rapa]
MKVKKVIIFIRKKKDFCNNLLQNKSYFFLPWSYSNC